MMRIEDFLLDSVVFLLNFGPEILKIILMFLSLPLMKILSKIIFYKNI